MHISLTPELEKYVQNKLSSGLYNSSNEVVAEALRLLIERDALKQHYVTELNTAINDGLRSLENEPLIHESDLYAHIEKRRNTFKAKNND